MINFIRTSPTTVSLLSLALVSLSTTSALAQDEAAESEVTDMGEEEDAMPADESAEPAPDGDDASAEEASGGAPMEELEEREPDGSTQLLLGMRGRMLITPKFLINMFGVDGGRTVALPAIGPEIGGYFGKTADGFMVFFSPTYVSYKLDETPFKGKNDDDTAWEIIESEMKVWYLTVDAMWDHKVIDRLSVNVGLGAGLGLVTGRLYRNEAYRDDADPEFPEDDAKGWPNLSTCEEPPPGSEGTVECPGDGNYGQADRWPVYPWLNFQAGIKYQPIDELVTRFELGLGSSGFWLGLGVDYALFL